MNPLQLSVVVVAFNMKRELPRTLRTLSCAMQRDITEADYEIIIVDNGSDEPMTQAQCERLAGNARIHVMQNANVSPVGAINYGIEQATGELIGVFIDGARMASPGLLRRAINASRLYERTVVGTLAFHLGPAVQMESVKTGYCQAVEDTLLDTIDWQQDGYRLFDISVFAGSSANGWFVVPAETNALFMKREHWQSLGRYEAQFVSAGGGLANLDMWSRACADSPASVVMLLGEATFHQFHGGVATNALQSPWKDFHAEYVRIRGRQYRPPAIEPQYFGGLHRSIMPSLTESVLRKNKLLGDG
jgi:glycosyltransferase involved in cell wall biosynthesis